MILSPQHPLAAGLTHDSRLVRAYRGLRSDTVPVWFMRQAGRSLPEYRELRVGTRMLDACLDPAMASEITLQPVRRHGVDAGIFFSDIVVPLKLAGVAVEIQPGRGPVFDQPLQGPLRHLRIKCTAAGSVAMVVLYAHEVPVTSFAVVTGAAPSEEAEALTMFTEAIRASTRQYQVSGIEAPFSEITTLPQRPLMVVIPWPQSPVAEQDRELVKELSWHLAAALIRA